MEVLKYILIGIYVIVCLALIIVAMMQSNDDSGVSSAVAGTAGNFYEKNKGRTKEGKLKKWTIILSVLFAVLSIIVSIMYLI